MARARKITRIGYSLVTLALLFLFTLTFVYAFSLILLHASGSPRIRARKATLPVPCGWLFVKDSNNTLSFHPHLFTDGNNGFSAPAAIAARCVIHSTLCNLAMALIYSAMQSAVLPPIPASISSKIMSLGLMLPISTLFMASKILETSPPETTDFKG